MHYIALLYTLFAWKEFLKFSCKVSWEVMKENIFVMFEAMEKLDSDDRMLSHEGRFAERDIVQVCHSLRG